MAEILRRWKTCSQGLGADQMEQVTRTYMDNLAAMGYCQGWREKVLSAAMTSYQRILHKVQQGTTRRNRMGARTFQKRRFQKLCGQAEW